MKVRSFIVFFSPDEETETQEWSATCVRSHYEEVELGVESSLSDLAACALHHCGTLLPFAA